MTDDSAFKRQVRARMAETGEKYTVARRMVMAAAQDGAIRGAVQESLERLIGLSAVDVDLATDRVHVTIRAARPGLAWGLLRPTEAEGVWRDSAAEQLRTELEELTGRRVRLDILQVNRVNATTTRSQPCQCHNNPVPLPAPPPPACDKA